MSIHHAFADDDACTSSARLSSCCSRQMRTAASRRTAAPASRPGTKASYMTTRRRKTPYMRTETATQQETANLSEMSSSASVASYSSPRACCSSLSGGDVGFRRGHSAALSTSSSKYSTAKRTFVSD
uniref:Uncharacterized protein n=1 Tax=Oryza rufipogon TaxID=4529 RepID=A0A0E0QUS3_ORYRU